MSRTCVSASERDSRRTDRTGRLHTGHIVLALTSVVAMLVIGLAYAGRLQTSRQQPVRVIDLNTVSSSKELESILERPAAQALFDFIQDVRQEGRVLPNVGAILKARRRASETPIFSPTDLAALKPSIVVRTLETFGRLTLVWSALYFLSFWVVALLWTVVPVSAAADRALFAPDSSNPESKQKTRGRRPRLQSRGDLLLLAAAHLLTAIGFAALLSRTDPCATLSCLCVTRRELLPGLPCSVVCPGLIFAKPHSFICAIYRWRLPFCCRFC